MRKVIEMETELVNCPRCGKKEQELIVCGDYEMFGECRHCHYNKEDKNEI